MSKPATSFKQFIVTAIEKTNKTTEQLYALASSRGLKLTKNRKKDSSRPTQFAWQHQLRRDQFALRSEGVIYRSLNGTWSLV